MTKQDKLRILVIDDEVTQRMLVKEYLEEAGHVVRQSDDGMHGLKMAIATKPDVILLDLLLPSMDGYSLCKSLKDRLETAAIPIILITASRGSDVIEKGLAAGADDFLTKPVDWAYLADRVMNVVRKSRERADMERLIHQTRHNERQAPPAQVNEFAKADLARIETEQLEALTRTTEQVRAECASELAALQHHHAEELRSLRERNALDIESIRVSGQHSLMVAEHRHAGEIQSLRSAYEELSAEFENRATGDAEAVASENAARVQAAWAICPSLGQHSVRPRQCDRVQDPVSYSGKPRP